MFADEIGHGSEGADAVGSLPELLDAVVDHQPDVVLTDIRMPPTHSDEGIQAAQQLRATAPDVAVVALSLYLEPDYALRLLADGSARRGYLLKDHVDDVAQVERAIRAVAASGSFVDDDVVNLLLRRPERWNIGRTPPRRCFPLLQG